MLMHMCRTYPAYYEQRLGAGGRGHPARVRQNGSKGSSPREQVDWLIARATQNQMQERVFQQPAILSIWSSLGLGGWQLRELL
jgi:hypothetical protein